MRPSEHSGKMSQILFGKEHNELTYAELRQFAKAKRVASYYRHHNKNKRNQAKDKQFRKRDLLKSLGWPEKCQRCGYDKCLAALDFHHKDPTKKDGIVLSFGLVWQKVEAQKCELVCSNCHREIHFRSRVHTNKREGRPRKPLDPITAEYMRLSGVSRPNEPESGG
jgi:hypothetical protein